MTEPLGEAFGDARTSFATITRARLLPVMLVPVVLGSVLAWNRAFAFSWGWFLIVLAGAALGHLGVNVIMDVADDLTGADSAARSDALSIPTTSGIIATGAMRRGGVASLGLALLLGAFALGLFVATRSMAAFWLGASAVAIAILSTMPPVRYASRVPGLGELGAFLAACMQVWAAYAVQAKRIDQAVVRASIGPALLIALVIFHRAIVRANADRQAGVPNTASRLGAERSLLVSMTIALLAFVALAFEMITHLYPWYSSLVFVGAFPLIAAYAKTMEQPELGQHHFTLLGASLGATLYVGIVLTATLVIERIALG